MRLVPLRRTALALAVAAATLSSPIAGALPMPPDGTAFNVYERYDATQREGAAAQSPQGRNAVVWREDDASGPRWLARVYAPSTSVMMDLELLSGSEAQHAFDMRVAIGAGDYVVAAWRGIDLATGEIRARARVFRTDGLPMGGAFDVSVPGQGMVADDALSVATTNQGYEHVQAWRSEDAAGRSEILARTFLADWPDTPPLHVSGPGDYSVGNPQVVALADDQSFAVVYPFGNPGEAPHRLMFASYGPQNEPIGGPEPFGRGARYGAISAGGDFEDNLVVAWEDLDHDEIWLTVRRADGSELNMPATPFVSGDDRVFAPRLAVASTGEFAMLYRHYAAATGLTTLWLQRYTANATPHGDPIALGVPSDEQTGQLSTDADGDLLAVWNTTDGESFPRVRALRLPHAEPIDLELTMSGPAYASHGSPFPYQLQVTNRAPYQWRTGWSATSGFSVEFDVPPDTWLMAADGQDWTCYYGALPLLRCDFQGSLAPLAVANLTVEVVAPYQSLDLLANARVIARHLDDQAGNDTAQVATLVRDITPEPFTFVDPRGVARSAEQISNEITITGIDGEAPLVVFGGSYSINGGPWQTGANAMRNGDRLRLRHVSAAGFDTRTNTYASVGVMSEWFTTTTEVRDIAPDAFAFADQADVGLGASVTSAPIALTGFNDTTTVSVSGGSWSRNGSPFTTQAGAAVPGDSIRVQHAASTAFATRTDSVLTVGGVSDTFSSTTLARDVTPDAFAFAAQASVPRGSERTSNEVTIGGINDAASVTVSGGSYSIDGAAFTTAPGTINAGQRLRLRHAAASGFSATTTTTATVGTASAGFSSTTEAQDAVPDAFAFADQTGLATAVEVTSAPVTVAGINVAAPVSVAGGSYSINGGAFTTAAGSVVAGDQVRVKHVSSGSANTSVATTLTIGGVSDAFSSSTGATDNTPNAFAFADVTGAQRNKTVNSAPVTVAGINVPVPISVAGGGARWSKNGGAYTTAAGTVQAGDVVRLQVSMPNLRNHTVNVQVAIGALSDTWSVTTAP
jgi:hypothetical protein